MNTVPKFLTKHGLQMPDFQVIWQLYGPHILIISMQIIQRLYCVVNLVSEIQLHIVVQRVNGLTRGLHLWEAGIPGLFGAGIPIPVTQVGCWMISG